MNTKENDGCSDVICARHGFLARVILNTGSAFCSGCALWIRAESDELRERRDCDREKKRKQRAKVRLVA